MLINVLSSHITNVSQNIINKKLEIEKSKVENKLTSFT